MSEDRNIYLQVMPIEVALHRLGEELDLGSLLQIEVVPAQEAIGRVTAEPVWARLSSPTFHSAAMDGVALKAESTFRAREGSPVTLSLERDFQWVNTGGPLPPGTDAVVMIEHVQRLENGDVVLEKPAFPWQHVRRIGEDIVASELLLPRNHEVSVYDLGALLTAGIWELSVLERVNIEFIPSGDEVVDFQKKPVPGPGQVVESNSQVLAGMARDWGCNFRRRPPVPDNISELNQAVDEAIGRGAHIVVLGAGSSAGSRDFTRRVIEEKGRVLVHGIKAMPGKPTIIGCTDKTVLIGAPGYPVSSIICFERILRPVVFALQHRLVPQREVVEVFLTRRVPSRPGMEEFLRVSLGRVKDRYVATPLPRGAGSITSMTRAQGLVSVPSEAEGLEEGSLVRAELLVPGEEIERTLVVVGSHDNTLDLLANELMALDRPVRMSSTHVGSMGGLTAIKGGNAHMAGIHLFDPGSEDFNFPFLKRYLPGGQVRLFNLAVRHQGLIVPRGNPKSIKSIEDLRRNDITFINRQRGAGTRILLDYHLEKNNIAPDEVKGYENEEFTHMAVAVNVLSGIADCGLGISAAAGALGLDFVPLARERYDLLVSEDSLNDPKVRTLLDLLSQEEVKKRIEGLGGYETGLCGREMHPGQGLEPAP